MDPFVYNSTMGPRTSYNLRLLCQSDSRVPSLGASTKRMRILSSRQSNMGAQRLMYAMLACWAVLCSSFALATAVDTPSDAQVAPDHWEPDLSEYGQHPRSGPALSEFLQKRQLGTDPPVKDLAGQTTPGGGRYPKQSPPVTGYGGNVWECPNKRMLICS
jgi:hypothetical protein